MAKRCVEQRKCEWCTVEYTAKVITARFCSIDCMYKWRSTVPRTPRIKKQHVPKVLGTANCLYCNKEFDILKNRKQLCSKLCVYEWRKQQSHENVQCLTCGILFTRYKNAKHPRTGLPTQYCSNICSVRSTQKKEKLKTWGLSDKNHWNSKEVQEKVKNTKKERYGDEYYNNMELVKKTNIKKYGVPYSLIVQPSAQGKRISAVQRKVYEQILKDHPDAVLEKWLPDAQKSVDIFIPSTNEIIEIYGTYWHCDPRKYDSTFYNRSIKMKASDVWNRDEKRKLFLESLGYTVKVLWEKDLK